MPRQTARHLGRVSSSVCRYNVDQLVVHASTVAFLQAGTPYAVVLQGRSGSGKSALALELLAMGALLVSDDQTTLRAEGDSLVACAPGALHGLIEWRDVGILPVKALERAQVVAWMDLDVPAESRMPMPVWKTVLGVRVPCLQKPRTGALAAGLRQYMIGQAWMTHGAER